MTLNYYTLPPEFDSFPKKREFHSDLQSKPLSAETIPVYDVVILVTDRDAFDQALIVQHAKLIIDTRGTFNHLNADHIFSA